MKTIPYGRQSIDETDISELVKVLKGGLITQGPKIEEFENSLTKYCGCKYAEQYYGEQVLCHFILK